MAFRAGAEISDIEFVQFHPTALHVEGAPCFLLSEALRGEGGHLRNVAGERFMERYHAQAELAPRDVVARAIVTEMKRTQADHVWLDLTHLEAPFLRERFPRIYQTCRGYGVDITRQPAPVRPAAHYAMGGVRTDLDGRTSLGRLFAAGEVACTGVHGANRLASNSLLEGVVFGARAGRAMRGCMAEPLLARGQAEPFQTPRARAGEIRRIAWERCGIVRCGDGLQRAITELESFGSDSGPLTRERAAARNVRQVADLIARCAFAREESRGAHFRTDFASKRAEFERHSVAARGSGVRFE
jgi:L-aspartate oxidase